MAVYNANKGDDLRCIVVLKYSERLR